MHREDPDPVEEAYLPWARYAPLQVDITIVAPVGHLCAYCEMVKKKMFNGWKLEELASEMRSKKSMHEMFHDSRTELIKSLALSRRSGKSQGSWHALLLLLYGLCMYV